MKSLSRRAVLASLAGLGAYSALRLAAEAAPASSVGPILKRAIPKTGEEIPAIGMGSWITFNVGADAALRAGRTKVLQAFFDRGGGLIDSSPMYGSSEAVIGDSLKRVANASGLFSATKVWIWGKARGIRQMEESRRLWGLDRFDLMQVHNLLDWETHLETLLAHKAEGRIRYVGVTTSHGDRHETMAKAMAAGSLDFAQFTYNILDREAEKRLLPLAAERGIAVIANRPFRQGDLFDRFARRPLPAWAGEIDCANWAQFLLKFVISHPAVTCAIPATTRVDHMEENMGALRGWFPDAGTRARMIRYVEGL
jgi:diketogulonate reductase-like aldo/keto reductase